MKKEDYDGKENVIIENMKNCEIQIPFIVKSIYIKHLSNCKLQASAVQNATFIDFADNCKIYLASHQIRIHNSKETEFHLVARSNPIIEHCEGLGFGNLQNTDFGKGNVDLQKEAGLDAELKNLFDQVQDFNWLKKDHSPNWKSI